MPTSVPAVVYAALVTLAAIVSATVVVWHGAIDGQTYTAIVTGALGLGAGAGIHAAGTQSAAKTVTRAAEAAAPSLAVTASTADLQAEIDRRKGS